jgi:hypothetical protein
LAGQEATHEGPEGIHKDHPGAAGEEGENEMKSLNQTRWVTLKYPRNTPRISRKRLWMDRSEWRQDPQATLEGSNQIMDRAMTGGRSTPDLGQTNYKDFADMMNRAGRVGIKKV